MFLIIYRINISFPSIVTVENIFINYFSSKQILLVAMEENLYFFRDYSAFFSQELQQKNLFS